jgi:hypothetical protein
LQAEAQPLLLLLLQAALCWRHPHSQALTPQQPRQTRQQFALQWQHQEPCLLTHLCWLHLLLPLAMQPLQVLLMLTVVL